MPLYFCCAIILHNSDCVFIVLLFRHTVTVLQGYCAITVLLCHHAVTLQSQCYCAITLLLCSHSVTVPPYCYVLYIFTVPSHCYSAVTLLLCCHNVTVPSHCYYAVIVLLCHRTVTVPFVLSYCSWHVSVIGQLDTLDPVYHLPSTLWTRGWVGPHKQQSRCSGPVEHRRLLSSL